MTRTPKEQLLSRDARGEVKDAITAPLTREAAAAVLAAKPYIVEGRVALGWSIWWGAERMAPEGVR